MWHAVQLNTSAHVLSKFGLQVAGDVSFEQADSIRGCSGSIRLLNNQLSPVIEPLETARDRERQEKSYQSACEPHSKAEHMAAPTKPVT